MATNLEFIKSVTPDGTSSSLSVTNCFSANYDAYVVNYNISTDSSSPKNVNLRLINSSDAIISNSNYDYAFLLMTTGGSFGNYSNENQAQWTEILGYIDYPPEGAAGTLTVYNPFSSSSYSHMSAETISGWNGSRAASRAIGTLTETTSCTGLNIYLSSTNMTSVSKVSVYGVK